MATRPADTLLDGVDLSQHVADPTRMAATTIPGGGKVGFVVRYLSPDTTNNPQKQLEVGELAAIRAAGLAVAVVWETTASRATAGYAAGQADARAADAYRAHLGMPDDMPIHWAIDFDATGAQVEQYARGWVSVLGAARCGAYGGIHPLAYLWERDLIRYAWQTYAWSDGALLAQATAYQYSNGHALAGNDVDYDAALAVDYGQWEPGGTSGDRGVDMTTVDLTPAAIAAVRDAILNAQIDNAGGPPPDGQPVQLDVAVRAIYYRSNYEANTALPQVLAAEQAEAATLAGLPAATAQALAAVLPTGGGAAGLTAKQQADSLRAAADLLDPAAAGG